MNFNEYLSQAAQTALYKKETALEYTILGLVNEAGEVAGAYKKILRGDKALDENARLNLAKECGDTLWYLSQVVRELGFDLETIAQMNIDKLNDRMNRGVIKGDGDNR